MWGRGRGSLSPSRGAGFSGNYPPTYPLTLGYNQYPQAQQGPQPGVFWGQQGGHGYAQQPNNKPKRDRLRRQGLSSKDSNYSSNSGGSRGAYSPRGSGIINAAIRNLPPPRPPSSNNRNVYERGRDRVLSRADSRTENRNSYQNKENRSQSRGSIVSDAESQYRMYFCPKCGENYSYRPTQNRYIGKVPLILHCSHTMCQECIYQNLRNNKVNCATCQTDSILTQEETPVCQTDMQNVFPLNHYIYGVISSYKSLGGYLGALDNMKFVSTSTAPKKTSLPVDPSDTCCFASCKKLATMYCRSCEGIYCVDCCTVLHKSSKKLMTHEPVLRRKVKFSLMLEHCVDHAPMQIEFFCKTCDLTACCYCVLDKHTDHERVALYHLTEIEKEEFKKLKKNAERALRQVLHTQRKAARLANFNTLSVQKDVNQYFADYHGKLETLEKKMLHELENFKSNKRGLDVVQSSLTETAEQLKQLVAFNEDKVGDKKLNLRGALDKLRDLDNIPRFLLNESGNSEPVRFVIDKAAIEALDDTFMIEKCEDSEYRLVGEKDLPESYVFDLDDSDSEVEGNISAILGQSNKSEDLMGSLSRINEIPKMVAVSASNSESSRTVHRHTKPTDQKKKKLDMQRIDVQHINSMDSFFIQYKNNQSKLVQLNKDIENYVKMGGAQPVDQPQLNDLYLAHYVAESHNQREKRWCRARLTDIKHNSESGPLYEMFFIDYGMTQMVDGTRIKDIPSFLAQKKPFAEECMLHNPMSVNWIKKAHVSLAKILNGKDVYMIVKSLNSGIHEVDLMIASSDGGITSVTDILVHAHHSVEPRSDDNTSLDDSMSLRRDGFYPTLRVFPNSKKFAKHEKEKVTIANVVDPNHIFVQLVKYQEAFRNMTHSIRKSYKHARASGCVPIEGTYVLVEHKDIVRSNWHRAFIKSVDLNSDKVHVLLVDWGINVVVPTTSIKALQESFTRLECQAVLVKLAHIAPYNAQATWSPHAANFLHAFHQAQDVLKMVVQEVDDNGVSVALFDITGNVDICVNTMMVENNLADSTGPISTKLEWPQFEIQNPTFSEEDGLVASMVKKVDEEATMNEDSEEDDCASVKKRQVDVVKVEAPDLIWVKFLEFRERESLMFKELQIHYSDKRKPPAQKSNWAVDERCVVEVEHEFARGKVREEVDGDYTVYLYDKARAITVPLDKMYVYDLYFMKYSQAVWKSHLANIRPAGDSGKWSRSSVEVLQEIFAKHKRIYGSKAPESDTELSQKSFPLDMWYAHVIHGGPLDPDRMKYVSINNFLVKLGFAYKIPSPQPSAELVKQGTSGEYLLKVLTGEIKKSIEENPVAEQAKGHDSVPLLTNQKNGRTERKFADEVPESPRKNRNKNKRTRKSVEDKNQCMKILESLSKPAKAQGKEVLKSPEQSEELSQAGGDDGETKKTDKEPSDSNKTEEHQKTTKKDSGDKEKTRDKEETKKGSDNEVKSKNWSTIVEEELGEPSGINEVPKSGDEEGSPYHKSEVEIDDWLPPFRLKQKDFQARVTCVETSGNLYIHDESVDEVYYKMEANIKEYFDKNPPDISDHKWQPGQLCTIKYTDGNWYRGKILKVKHPREISVFMIDFGSDHDLSPDVLFREVLYTDIGSFATKVKLDKVYTKTGSWLSSDYDHFRELVTDWCRIVVKGPLDVELPLVEVYNENGDFVNQKLIELCPNLSRCSSFPIAQGADEDDMVVIECIEGDVVIADEMLMDNLNNELDKKLVLPCEASSSEVKGNLMYKKRPLPEDLLDGKKVLLEIGGIVNYDEVVLKTPGESVSEEMYDLIIELQDAVESLPVLKDFKVGMPCLTPYSEDGVWYRARVTSTQTVDSGFVDVLFVDYGNSESVAVDSVRQITPEYMQVPQQTWEAALNIVLTEDADVISVMQVMNSMDRLQRYVKVVKEDPLTVDVYDKDSKLIYKNLVENGSVKVLLCEDDL